MTKNNLMDLIYDKLANNDEREMFEPYMTEDMCCVTDMNTKEPQIAFVIDGVEYVLNVVEHKDPNNWEVYEPCFSDRETE